MPTVNDFLDRGYFPRELPPPFTTASYAAAIATHGAPPNSRPKTGKLFVHYLARAGSLLRKLAIPNPVQFHRLVECIVSNWAAIATHVNASPFSVSKPTSANVTRAVVPAGMFDDMEQARHAIRALSAFIVRTDISQFYGTLYTHSLPWALHTKPVAKATRGRSLFGNSLDELSRNMQDGQTVGVPIGPDTSLVLAEIVLSAVDQDLVRRLAGTRACRQVDDVEVSASDRSSAERLLGQLQQALNVYELTLNPKKTKVIEQPSPFADIWVHTIRRFRFRRGATSQKFDLLAFYDLVLRSAAECPDGAIIKYSMSRLRPIRIHPTNWQTHERFLHQAMLGEPGVTPEAVSQLIRGRSHTLRINYRTSHQIRRHHAVPTRRGRGQRARLPADRLSVLPDAKRPAFIGAAIQACTLRTKSAPDTPGSGRASRGRSGNGSTMRESNSKSNADEGVREEMTRRAKVCVTVTQGDAFRTRPSRGFIAPESPPKDTR